MRMKKPSNNWLNKYPGLIFVLSISYSILNGVLIVLCFINAPKLGYGFLIAIGAIFYLNYLLQALIFKKRQIEEIRVVFGDDEVAFEECLRKCGMLPRKKRKTRKKRRRYKDRYNMWI